MLAATVLLSLTSCSRPAPEVSTPLLPPTVRAEQVPGDYRESPGTAQFEEPPAPIIEVAYEPQGSGQDSSGAPDATVSAAAASRETRSLPVSQLSADTVRQLLVDAGAEPEWIEHLIRIAWCESKYSPGAVGDSGNSVGLFQIGKSRPGWQGWFLYFGIDEATAYDPVVNAQVAVLIVRYSVERGQDPFSAWSCKP